MSRAARQQVACTVTREARGHVPGDGIELAFGYWPGRGLPVVGLHGLTASYVNFVGIAERLAGRCPLFAVDLRGRGDSDKPEGPYGIAQHARDVAAAMRALDLGPSVIVGHSMGAFISTALAAQNPELVAGLIMIDGGYLLDMPVGVGAEQVLDAMLAQRITQQHMPLSRRVDDLSFDDEQKPLNVRPLRRLQHSLKPEQRRRKQRVNIPHIAFCDDTRDGDAFVTQAQNDSRVPTRLIAAHAGTERRFLDLG